MKKGLGVEYAWCCADEPESAYSRGDRAPNLLKPRQMDFGLSRRDINPVLFGYNLAVNQRQLLSISRFNHSTFHCILGSYNAVDFPRESSGVILGR
jgi:hypothetical protein